MPRGPLSATCPAVGADGARSPEGLVQVGECVGGGLAQADVGVGVGEEDRSRDTNRSGRSELEWK